MLPFNRKLKSRARDLRKNMTEAEKLLWSKIRRKQLKGYQFYRQKNIGNYIVDFCCPADRLCLSMCSIRVCGEAGLAIRFYWMPAF
ncbi:MAG: DUF559 domain-containing protein [bacterium]|nr:DUF559 domain-containing protein [bacterium]